MIPLAARHKAMHAAENVDTSSLREAAILGAIVRCVISCGRINVPWCSQYTADIIAQFNLRGIDRSAPGLAEMQHAIDRFQQSYSHPLS